MVKLLFFCWRRPGLSRVEYAEHLLSRHLPLALEHHPRLRGYAVNLVSDQTGAGSPCDGIHALWFDSLEDYRERLYDGPEGERLVAEDLARFLGGAHGYATSERVHRSARGGGDKWIFALARRSDLERDDFLERWSSSVIPRLLRALPAEASLVVDQVQQELFGTGPELDLVLELGGPAAAASLAAALAASSALVARCGRYRVEEHVAR